MKNVLFIMDPLAKLDLEWDTSLHLAKEFLRRGTRVQYADTYALSIERSMVYANAHELKVSASGTITESQASQISLNAFDLIMIRKDPPFDMNYVYLTYLLESMAERVFICNHPRGIRNANEKLSCLHFSQYIPETLVSFRVDEILGFQKKLSADLVIKPLDQKGGAGIFLLKQSDNKIGVLIESATANGKRPVMAQPFIPVRPGAEDKRILLLGGNFLGAYSKIPNPGEFRGNLSIGGTFHKTELTQREKQLIADLKPYLLENDLSFAGVDTRGEYLIEINVTSPAGITELSLLYPEIKPEAKWADYLESRLFVS